MAKIINAFDKQIAEFNYKLLHNQLNCNYNVNKLHYYYDIYMTFVCI